MVMLGHGQGGMLIPYIFKDKPYFKAGMMLGVNQKRVQEMMIDQYNYLSKVTPGKKTEYDEQIERAIRSMNKKLNPLTQHHLMPYDVQATYWIWLNKYPHVKMATKPFTSKPADFNASIALILLPPVEIKSSITTTFLPSS